jgi:hypothetical protein
MTITPTIKQAMIGGVLRGVEQATANCFNVYKQQRPDLHQQQRTAEGLVDIALTAAEMLVLIEDIEEKNDA